MALLTLLWGAHSTFSNIRYEHTDYSQTQVMVALGWTTGEWWLDITITEHVACDVFTLSYFSPLFLPTYQWCRRNLPAALQTTWGLSFLSSSFRNTSLRAWSIFSLNYQLPTKFLFLECGNDFIYLKGLIRLCGRIWEQISQE